MFSMVNRKENFKNEMKKPDRTDQWCLALCCVCLPIGLPALIIYSLIRKLTGKKIVEKNDFSTGRE